MQNSIFLIHLPLFVISLNKNMLRFFICILFISQNIICYGQRNSVSGKVTDNKGNALIGATIRIQNTDLGKVADNEGYYSLKNIRPGEYVLEAASLGYKKTFKTIIIGKEKSIKVDFTLDEDLTQLDEIIISEKSESTVLNENPIQMTSIDTKILKSEATNTIGILTRAAGVRVRQAGGLGSNAEIQLNGLIGNAVRQYYNGIPLELLAGGISLNNIPVNAIDRIDIYKGVMPIDIGTDALAGGINVVPKEIYATYLDASYEFGSFNTHVAAVNGAKMLNDRMFVAFNGFFNYSDNNFKMRNTLVAGFETFINIQGNKQDRVVETIETVERFHDQHQSSFSEVQFGMNDLKWADRIVVSTGFSQRSDEVQHGAQIGARPVGEAERDNSAFFQNIQFERNFNDKFQLKYFGNYAIINDGVNDSTTNLYNWSGEIETAEILGDGTELLAEPSLRIGKTFVTVHRLTGEYTFLENYKLSLSNFHAYQRITGNDPIAKRVPLDNPTVDPNTLPSELSRNILAAQLNGNWFNKRLEALAFGKYYSYSNSTSDFDQAGGTVIFDPNKQSDEQFGFGTGIKLALDENRFFRIGYERAIRIPTRGEVIGDFITIGPNFSLRPEQSNNLNLGLFYRYIFSNSRFASIQIDWFLRDQKDLIRLEIPGNPNALARFINQLEVQAQGIEAVLKASPMDKLSIDLSFTYQDVINSESPNVNSTNDAGKPIPNIPRVFYNAGLRYNLNSPFNKSDELTLFGYYNHVQEFSLIFEGEIRNEVNFIPEQDQIDSGISYRLADPGLTFSLQVNNVTNAELFDNFRIPRPGRNYRIKIRFQI